VIHFTSWLGTYYGYVGVWECETLNKNWGNNTYYYRKCTPIFSLFVLFCPPLFIKNKNWWNPLILQPTCRFEKQHLKMHLRCWGVSPGHLNLGALVSSSVKWEGNEVRWHPNSWILFVCLKTYVSLAVLYCCEFSCPGWTGCFHPDNPSVPSPRILCSS
jgi:hypothetical protein